MNFMGIDSWIALPRCRLSGLVQHIPFGNGFLVSTAPIVPTVPGAPPAEAAFSFVVAPVLEAPFFGAFGLAFFPIEGS